MEVLRPVGRSAVQSGRKRSGRKRSAERCVMVVYGFVMHCGGGEWVYACVLKRGCFGFAGARRVGGDGSVA